jgi:hypothetical protein
MSRSAGAKVVNVAVGLVIAGALGVAGYLLLTLDTTGEAHRGVGRDLRFDHAALLEVDPALVTYEEAGRIALNLESPRGLAIGPDGRLVVAGDRAVALYGADGARVGSFEVGGEAMAVDVAPDGAIFVATGDHVEVFGADGSREAVWKSAGPEARLVSVAAGTEDVFAADAVGRVALRYDRAGNLVGRIDGTAGAGTDGFLLRNNEFFEVALGEGETFHVANPGLLRVEQRRYDGTPVTWWGESSTRIEGFAGCCNPAHFARLPDGRFVTSEKGLPRVKVYSPQGAFESVVAPPKTFEEGTEGLDLAVDAAGRVYVLDPLSQVVRVYVEKEQETEAGDE